MSFSVSGLAYLSLFISIGFLTYRFFQYWQEKKDRASRVFLYFGLCFTAFAFYKAIVGLFFAQNTQVLVSSVIFASFIQGLAAAIVAYVFIYTRLPNFSPAVGFWVVFAFDIILTILSIKANLFHPYLEPSGSINWGFPSVKDNSSYYAFLRIGVFLIIFIPLIYSLIRRFLEDKPAILKTRALGLSIILFLGVTIGSLDFFMISVLKFGAMNRDIVTSFLSILLFIVIVLTQKTESQGKNEL